MNWSQGCNEAMANAAVELVKEDDELTCVLIPTSGKQLLLPNVCVAEIVPWRRIKVLNGGPEWCLGFTGWRGLTIPVVDYSGFDKLEPMNTNNRCMVVMNRARTVNSLPFYALAAQSLPYMVQLVEEDLENDNQNLGQADVMHVKMGESISVIPDLGFIERQVSELHQHSVKR
ncbi:MAG: chemosensory pili system protein ChpC [Limisphaerales bacterium]|jgi:chemosensory pili system protein ChpC